MEDAGKGVTVTQRGRRGSLGAGGPLLAAEGAGVYTIQYKGSDS